jgi:hypothetical protein
VRCWVHSELRVALGVGRERDAATHPSMCSTETANKKRFARGTPKAHRPVDLRPPAGLKLELDEMVCSADHEGGGPRSSKPCDEVCRVAFLDPLQHLILRAIARLKQLLRTPT